MRSYPITSVHFLWYTCQAECTSDFCPRPHLKISVETVTSKTNDYSQLYYEKTIYVFFILHVIFLLPLYRVVVMLWDRECQISRNRAEVATALHPEYKLLLWPFNSQLRWTDVFSCYGPFLSSCWGLRFFVFMRLSSYTLERVTKTQPDAVLSCIQFY